MIERELHRPWMQPVAPILIQDDGIDWYAQMAEIERRMLAGDYTFDQYELAAAKCREGASMIEASLVTQHHGRPIPGS